AQPIVLGGERVILARLRDVTEHKQRESALQEKEHFLQRILDAEPGTTYIYDLVQQRTVYVNQHFRATFGYSAAHIEAMGSDVVDLVHPDDRPAMLARHQAWQAGGDAVSHK